MAEAPTVARAARTAENPAAPPHCTAIAGKQLQVARRHRIPAPGMAPPRVPAGGRDKDSAVFVRGGGRGHGDGDRGAVNGGGRVGDSSDGARARARAVL